MNVIIDQLEEIIKEHVLTEKVLVVPSRRDGNLAISALVKRGKPVINTKVKTFYDLAQEQTELLLRRENLTVLPRQVGIHFVYEALTKLREQKELVYFQSVPFTPSFIEATYQAILDLKQVKISPNNFPNSAFLKQEKGEDLRKIYTYYEEKRKANNFIDQNDLFEIAMQHCEESDSNCIYILFPHEAFDYIEKEFFLQLTRQNEVYVLSYPHVEGLSPLKEIIPQEKEITTRHPLRYLFHIEKGLEEDLSQLTLTVAINEDQEIRHVLKTMRKREIPFDQAVIYYPSSSPYVDSMLRHIDELELPVTFAEGIKLRVTKLGKFLKGLFQWIRDDFSVSQLTKLIREEVFRKEALPFKTERMIALLKRCEIRFGKDRYLKKLLEHKTYLENKATDAKFIEEYEQLIQWFEQWLAYFPTNHLYEKLNYSEWLKNLKKLLTHYVNDSSSLDQVALEQLSDEIEQMATLTNHELSLRDALLFTEQWLLNISVGASLPKPGHLHISPYRIGLYVDRPNVFIVGMDNNKFPGRVKEDPILLDQERRKIHPELTLGKEFVKRNVYLFTQLLLTTSGEVQMSYPYMDTVENRISAPSHFYLQLYRMKEKNSELTGEQLIEAVKNDVHFIATAEEDMIHPAEWLANEIWQGRILTNELLIEGRYENMIQALKARDARLSGAFTEYDGLVGNTVSMFDPRSDDTMTMTASKFEMLGTCPYSYFLAHILKVEDEEEEEVDRYRWLDPLARGNLLHKVFERFYQQIVQNGEKPQLEKHVDLIMEICDEELRKERDVHVPPSEIIFELERMELLESCSLFLKAEEEASDDGEPLYFEYSFGIGSKEPATIDVNDGSIQISGKIDRIDRLFDEAYQIIDYKTGSTYGFGERAYFNGGRKLQHTLYALAFENLFATKNASVLASIYSFPTLKGGGERVIRKQTEARREQFINIINHLCDILRAGHFPYSDTVDDCKYCNFQMICTRHNYDPDILQLKQNDETAIGWKALLEVRKYD